MPREPRWTLHDDGSFDVVAGPLSLIACYPAVDGVSLRATGVRVTRRGGEGSIEYDFAGGMLALELDADGTTLVLRTRLRLTAGAPHWVYPLAGARVEGAARFLKQGLGFSGPSGVVEIPEPDRARFDAAVVSRAVWSYDSYLVTAFFGPRGGALVLGAREHRHVLQRTTVRAVHRRLGLTDREPVEYASLVDAGFATERVGGPGDTLALPDLFVTADEDPYETVRAFARDVARASGARTHLPPRYHYCSWYEFERSFDDTRLAEVLAGLETLVPPAGLQTIQIDDYCTYGDWLLPNAAWPGTMEAAFGRIRRAGCAAGIWIGPFMVSSASRLFTEHPEWLLRDASGELVVRWRREADVVHVLDTSHPDAFAYLRQVFRTLRRWGATYFKTDFMDWGLVDSTSVRRHTPARTSVAHFVEVLSMIREEIGPDSFWLGCICPYPPLVGFADAIRVSNDVSPRWSAGSTLNMFQETATSQYANNVLWQNDPDVLYLRDERVELSEDEETSIALWDGILGGAINTSDRLHTLRPERLRLWRFLRPPAEHRTAALPFWAEAGWPATAVLAHPGGRAFAALVVNTADERRSCALPVRRLVGVERAHCFTWSPGCARPLGERVTLDLDLAAHQCALFYVSLDDVPPADDLGLYGQMRPTW